MKGQPIGHHFEYDQSVRIGSSERAVNEIHIGGLQSLTPAIDAILGGAVHKGLEFLLSAYLPKSDPRSEIKRGSGDLVWCAGEVAYKECLANLPEQIQVSQVQEGVEEDVAGLGIY
jgi:hypothetical protein